MRWYRHNVNFRNTHCYQAIRKAHGHKGLDVFRNLMEIVYQFSSKHPNKTVSMPWSRWLYELKLNANEKQYLRRVIDTISQEQGVIKLSYGKMVMTCVHQEADNNDENWSLSSNPYPLEGVTSITDVASKEVNKFTENEVGEGRKRFIESVNHLNENTRFIKGD